MRFMESDDDQAWDAVVEIVFTFVLIIDDLAVVKTTISRKELSDMRDISLIFTTKNQTESLVDINNQPSPFNSQGREEAEPSYHMHMRMSECQTNMKNPHHRIGKRYLYTSNLLTGVR